MKSVVSLFAVAGMFAASTLSAAITTGAKVAYLTTIPGDRFFFGITIPIAGTPSCNTSARYVVDLKTDGGKTMFAAVQQAEVASSPITIVGSGNCAFHPDSETASLVQVMP